MRAMSASVIGSRSDRLGRGVRADASMVASLAAGVSASAAVEATPLVAQAARANVEQKPSTVVVRHMVQLPPAARWPGGTLGTEIMDHGGGAAPKSTKHAAG